MMRLVTAFSPVLPDNFSGHPFLTVEKRGVSYPVFSVGFDFLIRRFPETLKGHFSRLDPDMILGSCVVRRYGGRSGRSRDTIGPDRNMFASSASAEKSSKTANCILGCFESFHKGYSHRRNIRSTIKTTSGRPRDYPESRNSVHEILKSLQRQDDNISIALRTKERSEAPSPSRSRALSPKPQYKVTFPGSSPQEAWRFSTAELVERVCRRTSSMLTCTPAVVLRILELIHEALVNHVVVSKR